VIPNTIWLSLVHPSIPCIVYLPIAAGEEGSSECPSSGALSSAEQEAITHAHNEIRNSTDEWRQQMVTPVTSSVVLLVRADP
jgi:hypothetical protein